MHFRNRTNNNTSIPISENIKTRTNFFAWKWHLHHTLPLRNQNIMHQTFQALTVSSSSSSMSQLKSSPCSVALSRFHKSTLLAPPPLYCLVLFSSILLRSSMSSTPKALLSATLKLFFHLFYFFLYSLLMISSHHIHTL